jgi:hypothetical protein
MNEIHHLRVNVKSLGAEARFIRQEIKRARTREAKESLAHHRMERLKPEARLAHLALAYVRGVPYKQTETATRNPVDAATLTKKIKRFRWDVEREEVKDWLNK